jgi:hypothetical protein
MADEKFDLAKELKEVKERLSTDGMLNLLLLSVAQKDQEVMDKGEDNLTYTLYMALWNAVYLEDRILNLLNKIKVSTIISEN